MCSNFIFQPLGGDRDNETANSYTWCDEWQVTLAHALKPVQLYIIIRIKIINSFADYYLRCLSFYNRRQVPKNLIISTDKIPVAFQNSRLLQ